MSLASDVALGHEIASFLAGTERPLTADEIALELGKPVQDVCYALLRDVRFEARPTWTLLPQSSGARGRLPAAAPEQHSIRVGSDPSDVFRAAYESRRRWLA